MKKRGKSQAPDEIALELIRSVGEESIQHIGTMRAVDGCLNILLAALPVVTDNPEVRLAFLEQLLEHYEKQALVIGLTRMMPTVDEPTPTTPEELQRIFEVKHREHAELMRKCKLIFDEVDKLYHS